MSLAWLWRRTFDGADSVYITERFGVRSLHIGSSTIQSSMRLARPNDLELAYTRSMMGFLLFNERPERVLMIGLGGGSLAKFVYHRMPWTKIEVVEVNPQVVATARQYFHVPPNDLRFTIAIADGAERVAQSAAAADVIAVDGYDADSQVPELSSRAFYEACRRRLNERGVLVVNLWGSDRKFNDYVQCIEEAFPAGTLCLPAERPGNVIVFAFRDPPGSPRWDALEAKARELEALYGLEFGRFVKSLHKMNRSDAERLYVSPADRAA
jgi:spermidine synthase